MKKLLLSCMAVLLFLASHAQAQNRTITGTVTDKDDGMPIPGVTVKVKGNQVGTQTSSAGKYSLKVTEKDIVTFSFIGYAMQAIPAAGKSVIDVKMSPTNNELNEVVVTGVGVATEKKLVAIDVATVGSKDFGKSSTTNVTQALTGQIAGLQIIQKTSQPGTSPTIQVRGFTSLGGTTTPLILVDGVQTSQDILTFIDPGIVDHVEVVKGSAGGMLYGALGANGVIQIFTKRGTKDGKVSIDVSSKYSNDRIIELNDIVAKNNHWVTDANGNILTTAGTIDKPSADGVWPDPAALPFGTSPTLIQNNQPYTIPTYDHVQQANRVANTFTNSLNVRGGSEKVDYAFGMSDLQQQDVFSNSYNRLNLNLNLGISPVKGLTVRSNTQLFYSYANLLAGSRFNMIMTPRFIDLLNIDPNTGRYVVKPSNTADGNNPIAERDVHTSTVKTPRLLQTFDVDYKFPKFLEIDGKYSIDQRQADSYDLYQNQSGLPQTVFFNTLLGSISTQSSVIGTQYGNGSVYFRTDFQNDFHLKVPIKTTTQVSYDFNKFNRHTYGASGTTLPPFGPYTITGTTTKSASESFDASLIYGYLVNQTIDYANLVGISGGFRSDYSSAFGSGVKPASFPRGTIFFNPSELFTNHDLVTNWKLRAAYGSAGIQPNGNFDRQTTYTVNTVGATNGLTSLIAPAVFNNPDLVVQTTKELELGTDITVTPLKNSKWLSNITISGTYWHRSSDNVQQTELLAPSSGGTGLLSNLIGFTAHGIELSADVNAYKSANFNWYLGARFAIAHTYVSKITNGLPINASVFTISEGQELGRLYAQTPLHSVDQVNPATGVRYIPVANVGNYTLVDGNVVNITNYAVQLSASNDLSYVGNVNPNFTSSLINRFNLFRKLDVSFQFDWNHGQKVYNATRQYLARDQLSSDFDKNVTINGNTGSYVAYWNSFYNALNPVSSFVEDGSFIRLRDVSISYNLTSVVHAKWIKSLVFTASGRNLATFTKYSGLDPEVTNAVSSSTGGGLGAIGAIGGVDYYGQPNLKSYEFGFNIGF